MLRAARASRRPHPSSWSSLALCGLLVAILPGTPAIGAPADTSATSPVTTTTTTAPPTEDDITRQRQRVTDLEQAVQQQTDEVTAVQNRLRLAELRAGLSLESYAGTVRELESAQTHEDQVQAALLQSQLDLQSAHSALDHWVLAAYASGPLTDHALAFTLLSGLSSDDIALTQEVIRRWGTARVQAVNAFHEAAQHRTDLFVQAQQATAESALRAVAASRARAQAAADVDADRSALAGWTALLARTRATNSTASRRLDQLTTAKATADQARALAQAQAEAESTSPTSDPADNAVTGPVGSCQGGPTQLYPNGQIPLSALCPLSGRPGHYLRADAAYAFERLSAAYLAANGTRLCLTDSYRSLAVQQRLFRVKPNLAAVPGTSNHGWGRAVDLCGGIQDFGTPAHEWMLANAPAYGWFHPSWAEPGGSRPEPWHWEFAG